MVTINDRTAYTIGLNDVQFPLVVYNGVSQQCFNLYTLEDVNEMIDILNKVKIIIETKE